MHELSVKGPLLGQGRACETILRALPEWFGIESATQSYIQSADTMPSFVAFVSGEPVGLLVVNRHHERSAEVHLMAVLPSRHRSGIGRALLHDAEAHLAGLGVEFLQVKTLSARRPNEHYERTRAFYLGVGFTPLEELPTLWGEHVPCLVLIKHLPAPSRD